MADDDDVPDDLWDVLANFEQSKNPTMTQAPAAAFQQPSAPGPAQPQGLPTWRPQHVQQLPLAAPSKPASLAQQLGSTMQFSRTPVLGLQQSSNQAQGVPRYTQYQQQQQQQPWQQRQQWGTSQFSTNRQAVQQPPQHQQVQPQALQQQQQQHLPPVPPESMPAPAAAAAAGSSAPAPFNMVPPAAANPADATSAAPVQQGMQPTQALTSQQLQQELEKLRKDLAAQAGMTTQLRNKLDLAEREKQQLQQRVQHQQYPTNSITQHKTQELEKQVRSMQQRLMFTEQELSEAKKKANDKESKATEVENRLKQLQDDLRKKEEQMLQMQFDLDAEKHRSERLAAAPAASGGHARPSQHIGSTLGLGYATPGSSGGRKRRLNTAATTPSPAAAAAAAEGVLKSSFVNGVGGSLSVPVGTQRQQQQQTTPLQQHRMQVQQLLGRQGGSIPQQQQQQHQQQQDVNMDHVAEEPAAVEPQATHEDTVDLQQQLAATVADQQQQQEQQQQAEAPQKGLIRLTDRVQQLQVSPSALSSLLWSTCRPAMQQILQPLSSQIPLLHTLSSSSSSSGSPATAEQALQQAVSNVLTVLAGVQQQLQAVASNASSSSATALLLQLLQLATVLIPVGGLGPNDAAAAAGGGGLDQGFATQAAYTAGGSSSRWVLQQPESASAAAAAAISGIQHHQQQQQYLVFRAVDVADQFHVLPLPLAEAVLDLVQGLLLHDSCCLGIVAAAVGASQVSGSHRLLRHGRYWRNSSSNMGPPAAATRGSDTALNALVLPSSASAAAAAAKQQSTSGTSSGGEVSFLQRGGAYTTRTGGVNRSDHSTTSSAAAAAAASTSYWACAEAAVQSVLLLQPGSSNMQAASSTGNKRRENGTADPAATDEKRTFFMLLADACRTHARLQLPVAAVLAALAGRLPATLQHLLLPAVADSNLVIQLLHSEGHMQRCQVVAVLQEMLLSHTVATAFAVALDSAAAAAAVAGNVGQDTIMSDHAAAGASDHKGSAPLQPSNRITYTQRSSRAAAKAAVAAAFQDKPQQQQQQGLAGSAAVATGSPHSCSISVQAVYDVLYGLLECISSGIGELPRRLDHSSSSSSSSSHGWDLQFSRPSSSSSSSVGQSCSGWGVFELQRRACAAVGEMFQTKQEGLLAVMLDGHFTSGFGLSQRLLALVDAACSAPGGDPFSTATPATPSWPSPAAAAGVESSSAFPGGCGLGVDVASASTNSSSSSITGGGCGWRECLERLRVVHEALLLLRALMAVAGPISVAAAADICSNMTSIRMVQTTREKLGEWSDAIAVAAAAASRRTSILSVYDTAAGDSPAAAGAAGLPLAPWAWAYSSSCCCRDKHSNNSSARVARPGASVVSNVSDQLLRSQRLLLQDCLQEISSAASSVHRRAIQYLS